MSVNRRGEWCHRNTCRMYVAEWFSKIFCRGKSAADFGAPDMSVKRARERRCDLACALRRLKGVCNGGG